MWEICKRLNNLAQCFTVRFKKNYSKYNRKRNTKDKLTKAIPNSIANQLPEIIRTEEFFKKPQTSPWTSPYTKTWLKVLKGNLTVKHRYIFKNDKVNNWNEHKDVYVLMAFNFL